MKNGWEPGGRLLTAWEEAGCAARASSQLSDHPVVIERIRAAFNALDAARLKAVREEMMTNDNKRYPCDDLDCPVHDPDPPRDFCAEALCIADGGCRLLAQREHIVALVDRIRDLHDGRFGMIANARAQAAGVADPVTREQLRESIDVAERAAQERVAHE